MIVTPIAARLEPDPLRCVTQGSKSLQVFDHLRDHNPELYAEILKGARSGFEPGERLRQVGMIRSFKNVGTEDIFNGRNTKVARRTCPQTIWGIAARKLDLLDSATSLNDLRVPPANRLKALKGNRRGQHSIRINDQYRVCFIWTEAGAEEIEIADYH